MSIRDSIFNNKLNGVNTLKEIINSKESKFRLPEFEKLFGDSHLDSTLVFVYDDSLYQHNEVVSAIKSGLKLSEYKTGIHRINADSTVLNIIDKTNDDILAIHLITSKVSIVDVNYITAEFTTNKQSASLKLIRHPELKVGKKIKLESKYGLVTSEHNVIDQSIINYFNKNTYQLKELPKGYIKASNPETPVDNTEWYAVLVNGVVKLVFNIDDSHNCIESNLYQIIAWDGKTGEPFIDPSLGANLYTYIKSDGTLHQAMSDDYLRGDILPSICEELFYNSSLLKLAKEKIKNLDLNNGN